MRALWAAGILRATMITRLAFYITNAGGQGISDLAVDPDVPTEHNQARKVARAFHLQYVEDNLLMQVCLPMIVKNIHGTTTVLQDTFSLKKLEAFMFLFLVFLLVRTPIYCRSMRIITETSAMACKTSTCIMSQIQIACVTIFTNTSSCNVWAPRIATHSDYSLTLPNSTTMRPCSMYM